jgi:fused signal recognition particle receptor
MFKFLKEKLKGWFKSSEEAVEEKAKKIDREVKPKEEKAKKKGKKEFKGIKDLEQRKPEEELKEEREIGEKISKDIEEEKTRVEERKISSILIEDIKKEAEEKEEKPKKGFFERIGLVKRYKISEDYFNEIFEQLELVLIENNVALEVVDYLRESLKKQLVDIEVKKDEVESEIKKALKNSLENLFVPNLNLIEKIKNKDETFVIVFFGINGSGKTTTIAKLAYLLKQQNIPSVIAASDTFRAASIEQLRKHGDKLGIKIISQNYGADPAAVAYDAIEYARARKIKVVLVDTAGRMHTNSSLLKEMEKIARVTKPDLKVFVAESITGNDVIEQAKTFNQAVGIDGIILSKADIDEKGGTSISVSKITGKPILFLGVGQKYEDLEEFDKDKLIKQLGL